MRMRHVVAMSVQPGTESGPGNCVIDWIGARAKGKNLDVHAGRVEGVGVASCDTDGFGLPGNRPLPSHEQDPWQRRGSDHECRSRVRNRTYRAYSDGDNDRA